MNEVASSEDNLKQKVDSTNTCVDSQNIKFLSQLAAVTAVYGGINMVTRSMQTLGLVNEKTAQSLMKVSAAVGIMAGSFNAIRGAVKLIDALKNAEILLSAIETYRAVLNNPAKLAAVAVAGGAAAGVAGYYIGKSNSDNQNNTTNQTSVTQNITFGGASSTDQRSMARDTLEMMGG